MCVQQNPILHMCQPHLQQALRGLPLIACNYAVNAMPTP